MTHVPILCDDVRSHRVLPIWNQLRWYRMELASVEHVVDSPLCWDLNLVIEQSHDPLDPEGTISQCVQLWRWSVGGDVP